MTEQDRAESTASTTQDAGQPAEPGLDDVLDPGEPAEGFRRDRREHGGIPRRLDDEQLARLTEEERVEAGIGDYDPDQVPPATDEPPEPDIRQSEVFQEARAEIRREQDRDELTVEGQRDPYPPTRYEE